MKRRILYGAAILLLAFSLYLLILQGSFTFGEFAPSSADEALLFWAVSTFVFILTVALAFILFRTGVKLYVARRANQEGSRIQTKLVAGALILSVLPTMFLVMWGIWVLNRNLDKWFSRPAEQIQVNFFEIAEAMDTAVGERAQVQANWLARQPEVRAVLAGGAVRASLARLCDEQKLAAAALVKPGGDTVLLCGDEHSLHPVRHRLVRAESAVYQGEQRLGEAVAVVPFPADLAQKRDEIEGYIAAYESLRYGRKPFRDFYLLYLTLITLFVLFVAVWIALFLARQISVPITALMDAAHRVRKGDLSHRIRVQATDELATLVRVFNDMTRDLQAKTQELEARRVFTEAILESIPTGVLSLSASGGILKVNQALSRMFPPERVSQAAELEHLFSGDDAREVRYLLNRARRTGLAARHLDVKIGRQVLHLAVTVSALDTSSDSGFVMVLEDTSELLRAQKSAAWNEVARRIAHEIKNPLTPIALSAERIGRQLGRHDVPPEFARILAECSSIISREVESVKTLVDEFSQFARFPAARPQPSDLNEVVTEALQVFAGRLSAVDLEVDLAPGLPLVAIDREQFKRVVVNLVDNAAEAMEPTPLKRLTVTTGLAAPDTVELVIADTGSGISQEDREKLFLPYFSTKNRGTGLGLAIVNHILAEHHALIRVEDNAPSGARFIIEIPAISSAEPELQPVVAEA